MALLFVILGALGALWALIMFVAVAIAEKKFQKSALGYFVVLSVCTLYFAMYI